MAARPIGFSADMQERVIRVVRTDHQILRRVIRPTAIHMMHLSLRRQRFTQSLASHQDMLIDIAVDVSVRMLRTPYPDVS
jgi:hypothetical protein